MVLAPPYNSSPDTDTARDGTENINPLNPLHPRRSEAATLISLADRVRRLCPSRTDPEQFHLEKSEIEHALRRLARES